MSKPRGVEWLEEQTGEVLDRSGSVPVQEGRHLSVRLPAELVAELEQLAAERGETVSQVVRRFIADGLGRTVTPDREALDIAIAALEGLRRQLKPPAA